MKIQTYCHVCIDKLNAEDIYEIDPLCEYVYKNNSGKYVFTGNAHSYLHFSKHKAMIDFGDGKGYNVFRNLDGKIVYSGSIIELMNYIGQQGWKIFKINYESNFEFFNMNVQLIFIKEIDV